MSRSFKKSPVVSPDSSKEFNSTSNRRLRTHVARMLRVCTDFDNLVLPIPREVSNVYDSPKENRCTLWGETGEELRKFLRK